MAVDPVLMSLRTKVKKEDAFRVSGQGLLDHYFMRPTVAKIVFVNKERLFVSQRRQPSENAVRQAAPRQGSHRLKAQSRQLERPRTCKFSEWPPVFPGLV